LLDPLWDLDKFEINVITAGVRRMICGAKFVTPAVGLRQIFEINVINTAGVRGD